LEGSKKQSPINIVSDDATKADFSDFVFTGYDAVNAMLINTGGSVQVNMNVSSTPKLTGGNLAATFQLAQFHFHWGKTDAMGSEHQMDGKSFPLEVHFVHFNTKYGEIGAAVDKDDGLAVLGFFFKIGEKNSAYEDIIDSIEDITNSTSDAEVVFKDMDLTKLMPGADKRFFRYPGSLTTPPCYESVTWTVFETPIEISAEQMEEFRAVNNKKGMAIGMNYRPVLMLNEREVHTNMDGTTSSAVTLHMSLSLVLIAALMLFFN